MPKATLKSRDREKEQAREAMRPQSKGRQNITASLPRDLAEEAKNTVYWTPGLSLSRLVAEALTESLAKIRKERGKPFPDRGGAQLTRGPAVDYRKE